MDEPIQEKAPKPPGLLPKNVQSWLIIGLAVLMIAIMWLTGGKKPPAAPKTNGVVQQVPLPAEVNETKIAELQSRIQDLQREQLAAQNALTQQTRLLGAPPATGQPPQPGIGNGQPPQDPQEDPIQAERKKRAYLSLFASNVALSYRKDENSTAPSDPSSPTQSTALSPNPSGPDPAQIAALLRGIQPPAIPLSPTSVQQAPAPEAPQQPTSVPPSTNQSHDPQPEQNDTTHHAAPPDRSRAQEARLFVALCFQRCPQLSQG